MKLQQTVARQAKKLEQKTQQLTELESEHLDSKAQVATLTKASTEQMDQLDVRVHFFCTGGLRSAAVWRASCHPESPLLIICRCRCNAQELDEENTVLHSLVEDLEHEVEVLRAREMVPKSEFAKLETTCAELEDKVSALEEMRRSQAWQYSPSQGDRPWQGGVATSGGADDASMSEMKAQEVIADLRRQLAECEFHVHSRDQAVAAAVAAFDSAWPVLFVHRRNEQRSLHALPACLVQCSGVIVGFQSL